MDTLLTIWEYVRPHVAGLGLLATWLGIIIVYLRRRIDWKRKRFANQVNFSLNYVADNKLVMRTLLETTASAVWVNEYGVRMVAAAAARTRADQPFIVLKHPEDMKFVKRAALNVLSERFSDAFLGYVMGAPVQKSGFIFAVTFENHPDMRTRKFRVLLVEEQRLETMFGPNATELKLEEPYHRDRVRVLQMMARLAAQPVPQVEDAEVLGRVELGVLI